MKETQQLKLVLQNGTEWIGKGFGFFPKKAIDGEVVFNTGMAGYPESLTDPSYRGQILVFTYPLIGNYGIPQEALEKGLSKYLESTSIHVRGVIVSESPAEFSHWQGKMTLDAWLKKHRIPGLMGIDTRALTQMLREKGVMLGKIVINNEKEGADYNPRLLLDVSEFSDPNLTNLVAEVSIKKKKIYTPANPKKTIIAYDCGMKANIIRSFLARGIRVIRVPWDYDLQKSKDLFHGVFISNGPGDPKMAGKTIESIRYALSQEFPTFGICLGSQLMALAIGGDTYKLKYGHRSVNQPCIEARTGRCYITAQNHGFAVDMESLPRGWEAWFVNANDGTNEGIRHKTKPFFAVQFHPEACGGPTDTAYLFDEFINQL